VRAIGNLEKQSGEVSSRRKEVKNTTESGEESNGNSRIERRGERRDSPQINNLKWGTIRTGNSLVKKLHVLMRVSQIYDANNVTFQRFMHENLEAMNAIMERERKLSLKILSDIFLNDQRLRYSVEGFTSFKYLLTQWKKKRIGGVTFKRALDEGMLQEFVYTMNRLRRAG